METPQFCMARGITFKTAWLWSWMPGDCPQEASSLDDKLPSVMRRRKLTCACFCFSNAAQLELGSPKQGTMSRIKTCSDSLRG